MDQSVENITSIFPLNKSKIFTIEEAQDLVPILKHISTKTKRELNILNSQLSFLKTQSEKAQLIQERINLLLQTWSDKVRRLGAIPVSMCKVRIPGENTQYIWEYPENKLNIV